MGEVRKTAQRVSAVVLVVEDDPEILRLMKQILSRDFLVHTAASAEDALQILRTEKVNAVVSDHMLPAMSGVELLTQVTSLQPDAARVLVTASNRVDTAQDAVNVARVRRFLTKPFRAAELLSTVGEAIHEVAVSKIKSELVRELKERNVELSHALATLEARDHELSSRLEGVAFHDGVTGLFTHRYFQETLAAEVIRARLSRTPLSLVLVDVDQFRAFNREHGYAEGDHLLRTVGGLLQEVEAASRYGSNRFAVLFPGASAERAAEWAEALRRRAKEAATSKDVAGPFTVRAGIATFGVHAQDEASLVDAAERALAEAKSTGGDSVRTAH